MFSVTFQVLLLKKCSQYEKTFFRLCLLTKRGRKRQNLFRRETKNSNLCRFLFTNVPFLENISVFRL